MKWIDTYTKENKPEFEEISSYVESRVWDELCKFIEDTYMVFPSIEYSTCSGAPGWNVKYKKSSRALCTLYPNKGYFTCLISIGRKEAPEAEFILGSFSDYLQEMYKHTPVFNGSRWLMIDVTTPQICGEVKELLSIRVHPPKRKQGQAASAKE